MGAEVIGRELERAAIGRALDALRDGPTVLLLAGPAGIGKTTVWEDGLDQARERGVDVLSVRPSASEVRSTYAGLLDLLTGTKATDLDALPAPQARALGAALLLTDAAAGPEAAVVAVAVLSLLEARASVAPVLLAVDDLQWLDGPTYEVLEFALRRCRGPVGLLAGWRVEPGRPAPEAFRPGEPGRHAQLTLGPLSLGALHEVVKLRLGSAPPRPTMVRIAEVSGGNPYYAVELARTGLEAFPDRLAGVVAGRLQGLDPAVRDALLVVSALGSPSVDLLARALPGDLSDTVAPAEDAGVVAVRDGRVVFTHPLLAEGAYAGASPSQRRAVHAALAEVVDGREERARHLALAAVGPDPVAIAALDEAAALARSRGVPRGAAELLGLAIGLGATDAARRIEAARHHLDAGDLPMAEGLLEPLVAELPPGPLRARALGVLGIVRYQTSDLPGAVVLFEQGLAEAGDDAALRQVLAHEIVFPLVNSGRVAESLPHLDTALSSAEELGDPGLVAEVLSGVSAQAYLRNEVLDPARLERMIRDEDHDRPSRATRWPSTNLGVLQLWDHRPDLAAATMADVLRRCRERGEETDLWFVVAYAVFAALQLGEVDRAEELVTDLAQHSGMTGNELARSVGGALGTHLLAWTGDLDARALAEPAIADLEAIGMAMGALVARHSIGALELAEGDREAADRWFAPALELILAADLQPSFPPLLPDAVEVLLGLGRADEAEALVGRLTEHGALPGRAWAAAVAARGRGLAAAARGDLDAAVDALGEALSLHDERPGAYDRARTLLARGRLHRRRKDRSAARTDLEQAMALFDQVGAAAWVRAAQRELDRVNPRHSRDGQALTPTERRVAELAAEGMTNKEVAGSLYISPKTVEANLARIYRKLAIRSRAELGKWWAEHGEP